MLEVFKFVVLCLISIFVTSLTASWFYTCSLFLILAVFFYDFDFTIGLERHAVIKGKYYYLKVRNVYSSLLESDQSGNYFNYTTNMNSINKQSSSFDLSRYSKTPHSVSPITNSVSNLSLNSKKLMLPRQTSTPLTKSSPWQKNSLSPGSYGRSPSFQCSIVGRSPRYSLSSVNITPKSSQSGLSPKSTVQTVTGPLLVSTRFNVNLGTYTETKSPGLTSRIVQYNNELSEKQTSTHQTKYGSPGLFPIVQLYKKEIPILSRSNRKCTVRIAPPDTLPYNSDQANTILRDSFVQNNNDNIQSDAEINTRSVLEALKEISRKRIHSNDDVIDDITKRQRKESVSSPSTSTDVLNKDGKRIREVTPPKPKEHTTTSTVNSAPKRICVVNEIESSLSSSRFMKLQQGQKRKAVMNSHLNVNKQRRLSNGDLVSKQTQTSFTNGMDVVCEPKEKSTLKQTKEQTNKHKKTTAAQTEKQIADIQTVFQDARRRRRAYDEKRIQDIDEENSTLSFQTPLNQVVKPFFNEEPLDIMRKNKLEMMLAVISGEEPKIVAVPEATLSEMNSKTPTNKDATDGSTREVVSILSPKNKAKHDKHVTFALPAADDTNSQSNDKPTNLNGSDESKDDTPKSSAVENGVMSSPSAVQFNFGSNVSSNSQVKLTSPATFANVSTSPKATNPLTFPPITSSVSPPVTNFSLSTTVTTSNATPRIKPPSFGAITTTTVSNNIITSAVESTNKFEKPALHFEPSNIGLNFDSSNGKSTASTTATITNSTPEKNLLSSPTIALNFGNPQNKTALSTPELPKSTPSNSLTNSFLFGTSSKETSLPCATASVTIAPETTKNTASSMFSFGAKTDTKTTGTTSNFTFSTPTNNAQSPPKMGGFKFDLGKSSTSTPATKSGAPNPLFPDSNVNQSGSFSFGANTTTSPTPVFGRANVSKNVTVFNSSNVTATTTATNTSTTSNVTNIFGSSTAPNGANMFGTPNTTNNTSVFGTPSSTTSTGIFGTVANIVTSTAAGPTFGTPTTCTATASVFGAPSTTVPNALFATPNTTTNTLFGTPNTNANTGVFGAPSSSATTGMFGAPTTTTSVGIFGSTTATPAFGMPKSTETTSGFGAFGAPVTTQNNAAFGNFSTPTTTQSTGTFGTFGTNQSTQSNAFGTPASTSSFTFGTNTASKPFAFGTPTTVTTTASSLFGTVTPAANSANVFGGNPSTGFGNTPNTTNAFSATTNTTSTTFGQQAPSVFGTAQTGFGSSTTGTVFGATNSTAFGSSTSNTFGTPNQSSTFGTNTSANQVGVFGMGAPNQSNTFNTANATQGSTFGSSASTTFGGFGATNAQPAAGFSTFGPPANQTAAQQAGVFAFGTSNQNSTAAAPTNAFQFGTGNQNMKPPGFNFSANTNAPNINFGAGASSSFGSAAAPAFGSSTTAQFNTTPATGMFNIGSGSTTPKQRPMMRARRRT